MTLIRLPLKGLLLVTAFAFAAPSPEAQGQDLAFLDKEVPLRQPNESAPLKTFLDQIAKGLGITIDIDTAAFRAAGVRDVEEWLVELPRPRGASASTALQFLASQVDGALTVRNGRAVITHRSVPVPRLKPRWTAVCWYGGAKSSSLAQ